MKGIPKILKTERGQVLPIVVLGVFVAIALSALIIDGGSLMMNRRIAQAAADAGALAGSRVFCFEQDENAARAAAMDYAVNQNGATSATVDISNGTVTVTTETQQTSFFARIFNKNTLTSKAIAEAGCFSPLGNYLMPIAWSCRPPVTGGVFDELGCKIMTLDWDLLEPVINPPHTTITYDGIDYSLDGTSIVDINNNPLPQIYIVMDKISTTEETLCKEDNPTNPTAIVCDLNGDGKNDIEGGGNRGWLDLNNGGGGTSSMRDWIQNGLDFPLSPHTWLSGEPGTTTPVYVDMKDFRQGQVVLIPVFNSICNDRYPLENAACMTAAHSSPWEAEPTWGDVDSAGATPKFHIITFDAFYISCVYTDKKDKCPGFLLAQKMNPDPKNPSKSLIPDNIPAIEGYFLSNYDIDLDVASSCEVNLGNCVISLIR